MSRVVEFVNEYADPAREAADEQGLAYPDAVEVLQWTGPVPVPAVGELVAAANAIFRVFASANEGRALDELNELLRSARLTPVATESGLSWTVETPEDVFPAALVTCLLAWLMRYGPDRLGTCQAVKCVDVYADASPAGRRRFCSSTCLNRHKVAAYRQRSSQERGLG
jgi:predicted RNA-binding Zn ribbon-like protein